MISKAHFKTHKKAFSLIELLVVMAVIGILAGIVALSLGNWRGKAYDAAVVSDANSINAAEKLYVLKSNSAGKAWDYSKGIDIDLNVSIADANLAYVTTDGTGYCIRVYSPSATTYNSLANAYKIASYTAACNSVSNFARAYGGSSNDSASYVALASDGGYVITGTTASYGSSDDMFLAKFNINGALVWAKTWGGTGADSGKDVIQASDGTYVVVGTTASYGAGSSDAFIAKFDSNGGLSWQKTWGGTGADTGDGIVENTDGTYSITGKEASQSAGFGDIYTARFSSAGSLVWNMANGTAADEAGSSIVANSDGGVTVLGWGGIYTYALKYNSSGTLIWQNSWTFDNSAAMGNYPAITLAPDGGYVMTGVTMGGFFVYNINSSGSLLWSKTIAGTSYVSSLTGYSVIQSGDGGYIIAGNTYKYGSGSADLILAKIDRVGALSWLKTFGASTAEGGNSVIINTTGQYAVVGYTNSYGSGLNDFLFNIYNSDGTMTGCSSPMCQSISTSTTTLPAALGATWTSTTTTLTSPAVGTPTATPQTISPTATSIYTN
jgi:prepilin-type N-terminal cleavage/methylation domain-containing protein